MKNFVWAVIAYLMFFVPVAVFAGGGRYNLESYNGPGIANSKGVNIQVWIYKPNSHEAAVGERAEFRIRDPRPGDNCQTFNTQANEYGIIFGKCSVTQAGQILAYVHSFDVNDDSSPYVLYFNNPSPTLTSIPLPTATPVITLRPTANPTPTIISTPPSTPTGQTKIAISSKNNNFSLKSAYNFIRNFFHSIFGI